MDKESREMFQRLFEKLDNMESKLDKVESRLDNIESRLDKVEGRLDKFEGGQAEIKFQLYRMDRKISDTYNLALDAWGQGVENRQWLEGNSKIKA